MKSTQILMNKLVFLSTKVVVYGFCYDYVKPREKAKLCFMETGNFIVYVKTKDIYVDIGYKDVEARFDSSSYELVKPLTKGKNEQVIRLMKDELGRKIMKEFSALTAKTYSYLTENIHEDEKAKDTKACVIKKTLNFKIMKIV